MKALVGAFNQEKALVGAFSVIVKTDCETDGALHSTSIHTIYTIHAPLLSAVGLIRAPRCFHYPGKSLATLPH